MLPFYALLVGLARAQGASPKKPETAADTAEVYRNPTNGLGSWIWTAKTADRQTCQLWKAFEIPAHAAVTQARLCMTVDNEFTVFLDGRELGRGAEWRELFVFDLTPLISPGKHVLAVRGLNSFSFAGLLLGLQIDLADGRHLEIHSDQSWRIVPNEVTGWENRSRPAEDWPAATVLAPVGGTPWWQKPENINIMPTLQPLRVSFWQTGWFQLILLSLCGIVVAISLRLVAQLAWHRQERWLLQQERARIARDIHDDLGSRMTRLVLHGEVTQSELPADSPTRAELEKICEQARGILSTLDEILWAVNPKRDTFRDFTAYVCGYAQEFLEKSRIQCLFDVDPSAADVALSLPLKRTLLMGIKEALNNAVKYSGANELVLTMKVQAQQLQVVVADNGKGFEPATLESGGNGLTNMVQRMRELDGQCVISSQAGQGCRIEFTIPLKRVRWSAGNWLRNWKRLAAPIRRAKKSQANEGSEIERATEC